MLIQAGQSWYSAGLATQIRPTSGTCRLHVDRMWPGSGQTLCCYQLQNHTKQRSEDISVRPEVRVVLTITYPAPTTNPTLQYNYKLYLNECKPHPTAKPTLGLALLFSDCCDGDAAGYYCKTFYYAGDQLDFRFFSRD